MLSIQALVCTLFEKFDPSLEIYLVSCCLAIRTTLQLHLLLESDWPARSSGALMFNRHGNLHTGDTVQSALW